MRTLLLMLLIVHGGIHLLGFAKGFGLAEVAALPRDIGARNGAIWLAATALLWTAAALLVGGVRVWWVPALAGVVVSQAMIMTAWSDARFGTIANLLILVPVLLAVLDYRPTSLRSRYERDVEAVLATAHDGALVTEDDLLALPAPVRTWLRRAGVVGRPRTSSVHVVLEGELRSGRDEPWMKASVEQYEFFDPVVRLFFMQARRAGVPFDVLHRYAGSDATMQARVLGLVPVLDAGGPEMTQSETVTLLNDMVMLAPSSLIGAPVEWKQLDASHVRATLSNAGQRVSAVLSFDEAGDIVGFDSDDRYQSDGRTSRLLHWSTPVLEHGDFDGYRLPRVAEARWTEADGEWCYGRFTVRRIRYNVGAVRTTTAVHDVQRAEAAR